MADAFFALLDPAMDERIEQRGDKFHIDLKEINRLWLLRAGIDPRAHRRSPRLHQMPPRALLVAPCDGRKARRHGCDDLPDGGYAVKRRLAALLCALALSLSLAGCWSSDVSDEGNDFWEEPPEQEEDNPP